MERLTNYKNGVCVYIGPGCKYQETGEIPAEVDTESVRAVLQRLAAYEDTGLAPEEIADFQENYRAMASQFADYKAAEVTGRLMFNPYRVGDTVFVYADGEIKEETVKQIFVDDRGAFLSTIGHFCGSVNSFSNFGKTVFPTREAAEETLKGQEG